MKIFENIDKNWLDVLDIGEIKKILKKIYFVTSKNKLCPKEKDIFEFARITPFENIKVIIIGQDCYQTEGYAQGISFSTRQSKTPPALRNIYKCLYNSKLIDEIPSNNNLECWAKQGVLLLNIGLTTEINKSGAHISYWREYSQGLINRICLQPKKIYIRSLWQRGTKNQYSSGPYCVKNMPSISTSTNQAIFG